ncbi:hypothetical protein [Clostridium sp. KNHs205]|jgi:hypothetical protein|uniref:hypothetical protein n=1 Tax=Clostridium sp. KNHs205 TaxID=1449050 RepID=UPI00051C0AF2|nr:hypothetical protein [Clostridium sp. KNHs205]
MSSPNEKQNNLKATSNNTKEELEEKYKKTRDIYVGSAMVHKAAYEPQSECNPDNGAFFEERSNPLSSKGN